MSQGLDPYTKLLEITLASSTPISLGGYDTLPARRLGQAVLTEPFRTQSLRGVARWWSRSLIAGILYAGGLNGERLVRRVLDYSGLLWGSSFRGVSGLRFKTRLESLQRLSRADERALSQHSRVRLLGLGRRGLSLEALFKRIRGSLILEKATWTSLPAHAIYTAIYSLLLSFVLGCLGKGSRRGLGCFDLRVVEGNPEVRSLTEYALSGRPERLIRAAIGSARNLVGSSSVMEYSRLPSIPAIAKGVFRLYRCRIDGRRPLEVAVMFSKCVVRGYRRDGLARRRQAWILGLPRSQRRTGYFINDRGVERRASPIMLAVHGGWAYMSVFYSRDWPSRLTWRGLRGDSSITVSDSTIRDALNAAVEAIISCLSRSGIHCEEVELW